MKKTEIILIGVIVVISIIMGNQIYQDNLKMDFLSDELTNQYSTKLPNDETTCGDGTIEIDEICYGLELINEIKQKMGNK